MLSKYIKSLDLNKSNINKIKSIVKLYPYIYKKINKTFSNSNEYNNIIIEIADYNDYHKYTIENDKKHYLNILKKNKNELIILWFLKYSIHYELILISNYDLKSDFLMDNFIYININYKIDESWISASKTRNYLLDDPLVDYLEYNNIYNKDDIISIAKNRKRKYSELNTEKTIEKDTFLNTILSNGIDFEKDIIIKLKKKYSKDIVTIIELNNNDPYLKYKIRDPNYSKITFNMMKKGIPIIYQGVLHDEKNKVYGLPDLLIRGDYINKIFDAEIDVYTKKIESINNYPYYIVDIKNSNIHLSARSDTILNNINCKPYKGQITIYHKIISDLQEYDTKRAFILPSKWTRKIKNDIFQCANPFDRLGIIDFDSSDIIYYNLSNEAIKWLKLIRNPTNNLNCNEPNNLNMYPNMSNQLDGKYKKIKRYLADKNDEITNIWMCGVKQRKNAINNGITKWSDPNLNSSILGINGKNSKILDLILEINRSSYKNIYPDKIKSNLNDWRNRNKLAFYIDFETVNNTVFEPREFSKLEINHLNTNDLIFMIGIGYTYNNEWTFKYFLADELNDKSQIILINNMKNYIKYISELNNELEPNLYHWSNFEPMIFNKLCNKYNLEQPYYNWTDILKMFHEEPIIIKGSFNFSLKNIGKAMYNLGYITTIWDENINVKNGLDAMFQAFNIYKNKNNLNFEQEIEPIIKYNNIDCKIMWDILNALNEKA
jgi:hypothetical protein